MFRNNAIGIDLGTSYSSVGVFKNEKVEIIANDEGNRMTPSYVAFTDNGRLLGDAAKEQASMNPNNTVFGALRLLGRRFNDPEVQRDMKHWPFGLSNHENKPKVLIEYRNELREYTPQEMTAMVLQKMKENAETFLGEAVKNVVVTVPSKFNETQRQAVKDAAAISGLNVLRIMDASTAAAIAYGLTISDGHGERNVLVFDLGGGTTNVSLLTFEHGVCEVKATAGDNHLGGEDFDSRLVNHFVAEFKRKHRKDLFSSSRALRRLRTACERAKWTLSSQSQARIEIDYLFEGIDFSTSITRARFEELCADLFRNAMDPVNKALYDAKMDRSKVDEIVLVGRSSRIPEIQRLLLGIFDGKELTKSIDLEEAVVSGAAITAAILSGDRSTLLNELLLLNATPNSLGIETAGGVMSTLIKRCCTIPTINSQTFRIRCVDNAVVIKVYEGERAMTKDNYLLGELKLSGSFTYSSPEIKVTFDIDANSTLNVTARNERTGIVNKMLVTSKEGLSKKEIARMIEEFREEEVRIRSRTSLEKLATNMNISLKDSRRENDDLRNKCKEVIAWLNSNQTAKDVECNQKKKQLETLWNAMTVNEANRRLRIQRTAFQ